MNTPLSRWAYSGPTCYTCPLKKSCPAFDPCKQRCRIGNNLLMLIYVAGVAAVTLAVNLL